MMGRIKTRNLNYGESKVYGSLVHALTEYERIENCGKSKEGSNGWGANDKDLKEIIHYIKEKL